MSHSIYMSSVPIDTKSFVFYHQFNNIKLSFFVRHTKRSFLIKFLIEAVRLLHTLE